MEATIPQVLRRLAGQSPEITVQMSKDSQGIFQPTNFQTLLQEVKDFAQGLMSINTARGDRVGLISDNRKEWLICDLAILCLGAADVPRGTDSTEEEIAYILSFSECRLAVVENQKQLEKIAARKKEMPSLKEIIVIDPDFDPKNPGIKVPHLKIHSFAEISEKGRQESRDMDKEIDQGQGEDTATIIFTSGTTGEPKGVMLTHKNYLYQMENITERITVLPRERWLSILPVWHSFERVMQYVTLATATAICYSKPVGSILLEDMQKVQPQWMASVPRIWESVRDKIYLNANKAGGLKKGLFHFFVNVIGAWVGAQCLVRGLKPRFVRRSRFFDFLLGIIPFTLLWPLKALGDVLVFKKIKSLLGGKFKAGISGGGALPSQVDKFFQAAGILLLEGYGLTESAPVLSLRYQNRPVPGTIGPAYPLKTELQVRGEKGEVLGPGKAGVLYARGDQVMKGYYNKPELTAQALDKDGWLNTGDLAKMTYDHEVKIVGRAKDTIVLLGGENIEPAPIEERLKESSYIAAAVVVGQDKKFLCALIIPAIENLKSWAESNALTYFSDSELCQSPEVKELITQEISSQISSKTGFKIFEYINRFAVLSHPFEVGKELSAKQEVKRHAVDKIYAKLIGELFA